jgi:putative flippase GtrA
MRLDTTPRTAHTVSFLRWMKFNAVGLVGIGVQLAVLALLLRTGAGYLLATALAVEAAILHNFFWHRCFTWSDRRPHGRRAVCDALLRFNLSTGLFSIGGNLLLMRVFAGAAGLDPLVANGLAIACCSVVNFLVSDRFVFSVKREA